MDFKSKDVKIYGASNPPGGGVVLVREARVKIARMSLTIKLNGNWSNFELANSAPPLNVTEPPPRL